MRLEIHHYETLQAVHEHGSVTRAAEALGISQSAVSHRLASAARIMGRPVHTSHGGGASITLTADGNLLAMASADAMNMLRTVEESVLGDSPLDPDVEEAVSRRLLGEVLASLKRAELFGRYLERRQSLLVETARADAAVDVPAGAQVLMTNESTDAVGVWLDLGTFGAPDRFVEEVGDAEADEG